ncbi:MAG: bifunctional 2-C-methyl-D-erythritol 4-phosphate cytidylyltransferase/2-C-methyl-D-erythritol 2,4-cyclodiphosphate synthase [Alphaproteobacteria bacterium]|nr:bifunctional 2-C-methyl-D-erythritol 4-phosphate cytidylyltransferase/2-C-methyl-D-erythritol 2,4-cyclodiphosphate synthase [Alphaproteobacteria bacterium]
MKVAVLIVAAGRGQRVGGDVPKQYLPVGGKIILRRSIEAFLNVPAVNLVQIVIHQNDHELYQQATAGLSILPPVTGGATRQQSVMRGLQALGIHEPELVLIHDAARPFVTPEQINHIISKAVDHGAAIPVLPLTDTIKRIDGDSIVTTVERRTLIRAQTPQAFRFKLIFMAHKRMTRHNDATGALTDDCAVAESCGIRVLTIAGDERNFKITTSEDITRAEEMIRQNLSDIRTGMGLDVHGFEPGKQVILGGVAIAHDKKLKGHSDADVALHALTDAMFGAIGDGDIGSHFPPDDDQWRGVNSAVFLKHAAKLLADKGGVIANIDLTIICEAPKIGPHREAICDNIAAVLGLETARISVKATTTERLGFTGRREGIAAQAIVTIRLPE